MNNLTSFTAYFNSIKQTLQSHSINYIELNNKIKELEATVKSAAAAADVSTLINDTVEAAVEKHKPDMSSLSSLINNAVEAAVARAVATAVEKEVGAAVASLNIKDSIKDMINDSLSKIDFKSMIDKYIEEKLSLVVNNPIEEVNILELSQAAEAAEEADVLAYPDDFSPDGSQQGSHEDDITIGVKKEKKTTKSSGTKKRTPKVKE